MKRHFLRAVPTYRILATLVFLLASNYASSNSQYVPGVGNVVYFDDARSKLVDTQCANRFVNKIVEKLQNKEYSPLPVKVAADHPLVTEQAQFGSMVIYWELRNWEISVFPTWQQQIVVKDTDNGDISVVELRNLTLDFDQCEVPYATVSR